MAKRKVMKAKWKAKERGVPNGLEKRHFDEQIKPLLATGHFVWSGYECWSFSLTNDGGQKIQYTPDWVMLRKDGTIVIHEVKGGVWRGDSRLRFKLAADRFPFFDWEAHVYKGKNKPAVEVL